MKIKDIAKLAGVSVATVSRVLNNKNDVSEKTKENIKNIIKKYDYRPNSIARNLVKNQNNTIGIIIPDIKNIYFSNIINSLIKDANEKDLNVLIGCSNEDFNIQDKYIDLFIKERVKGIIIVVTKNSKNEINYFENIKKEIPLIFIDRKISDNFSGIFFENYNSTYLAISNMIKKGSKKIAFITGPLDISTAFERYEGYKRALKDNNILFNEDDVYYGDFSMESGYDIGMKIIEKKINSIYISNNLMTLGFIKAVIKSNKNIDEYNISTFENNEILDFLNKNVKSNIIPFDILSKKTLELLSKIIVNKYLVNIVEIKLIDSY